MPRLSFSARVSADTLVPAETPTPHGLLRQADCYQQVGVKYPQRGTFHSYAELLHAALLEGDSTVSHYVPQPYRLRLGRRIYIPDCYVVQAGQRRVVELKPRGEFDDAMQRAVTAFLAEHRQHFEVIANESVFAREQEALNWLHIVRALVAARALDTCADEQAVLDDCRSATGITLGALCDPTDRLAAPRREIALYRLLHRGRLRASLAEHPLDFTTEVRLCD